MDFRKQETVSDRQECFRFDSVLSKALMIFFYHSFVSNIAVHTKIFGSSNVVSHITLIVYHLLQNQARFSLLGEPLRKLAHNEEW
jgi:hypothetical protein